MAPHRGVLILVLGILSLVGCSFFTGIPAVIMGGADLKKMDAGEMDPEGRQFTNVGRILGIVSLVLAVLACVIYGLLFATVGVSAIEGGGMPMTEGQ